MQLKAMCRTEFWQQTVLHQTLIVFYSTSVTYIQKAKKIIFLCVNVTVSLGHNKANLCLQS